MSGAYQRDDEEVRGLWCPGGEGRVLEERFVARDRPAESDVAGLQDLVEEFQRDLANADKPQGVERAVERVAPAILERTTVLVKRDLERAADWERALYWARLKMGVLLKSHPLAQASPPWSAAVLKRLEQLSRGYGVAFREDRGGARVLITGFDPYGLEDRPEASNPSGLVALALQGQTLGGRAQVASAIFPVRYRDFDAGCVEAVINPLLPNGVDVVVTISQNGQQPHFDVERFAGQWRAGRPDNMGCQVDGGACVAPERGAAFYETTLPVAAMVSGPFVGPPEQDVYFKQSYQSDSSCALSPRDGGVNANRPEVSPPEDGARAVRGSGGDYLSNEIFYRVAHRRELTGSPARTGHLHIPATAGLSTAQMVERVRELLERCVGAL